MFIIDLLIGLVEFLYFQHQIKIQISTAVAERVDVIKGGYQASFGRSTILNDLVES